MAVALALVLVGGCGEDGPSADEARVCSALQAIVDDLAGGRSQSAIERVDELQAAVTATSNGELSAAGEQFFEDLFIDVDPLQLTVEESADLGREYLPVMSRSMGRILNECAGVGAEVERLPAG